MILRPESDAELIGRARDILADGSIPFDTRTMVALLLLDKRLHVCPPKSGIGRLLAGRFSRASAERVRRMVHDAERAGYFVRLGGQFEGRTGRRSRFWFVAGGKPEISAYANEIARI
jgi:hypothetical protein